MKLITMCNRVQAKTAVVAGQIPVCALTLMARLAIFTVFWRSVQTKINGLTLFDQHFAFWNVTDSALLLFRFEYNLPLLSPSVAAHLASFGEFFFALMILLGFFTRFAALGLLVMTLVIQLFVYPSAWPTHLLWAVALVFLIRQGSDRVSVDYWLGKFSS